MNWVGALLGGLGLLIGVGLGLGIAALVRRGQHVDGLTVPQVREIVGSRGHPRGAAGDPVRRGGGRAARRGARVHTRTR